MERITHELQSFRSLHEPLYRPTGMEDMRLVGAGVEDTRLHGVEDTRLHGGGAEYMFQFEDDFDAEAWMWEG